MEERANMFSEWVYTRLKKSKGYIYNDTPDEKLRLENDRALFSLFYDISWLRKDENETLDDFVPRLHKFSKNYSQREFESIFMASYIEETKTEKLFQNGEIIRFISSYNLGIFYEFSSRVVSNLIILQDKTGFLRYDIEIKEEPKKSYNDLYMVYPSISKGLLLKSENGNKWVKIIGRNGNEVLCIRVGTAMDTCLPYENNELPKFFRGSIESNTSIRINSVLYKV